MKDIEKILVRGYLHSGVPPVLEAIQLPIFKFYKSKYWSRTDIDNIIPENKHREQESIYTKMLASQPEAPGESAFLGVYLPILRFLEVPGLFTKTGMEYCKYNPYTLTGRPSNTNNGINYAALNKNDGSRDRFESRFDNGALVEFDFDAYHLRLIARLIDYEFPEESVHDHFGKFYFDTERLTTEEYEESKRISFRVLYGGIPKEFEHIEYYRLVKQYIFKLWDSYNDRGYIETPIFKRRFYKKNYEEMNPQKLFNYLIQAYETEKNIKAVESVRDYLSDKETIIALYTYDSLLFDVSPNDGKKILKDIQKLMDMPTKAKYGKNYGDMVPLAL